MEQQRPGVENRTELKRIIHVIFKPKVLPAVKSIPRVLKNTYINKDIAINARDAAQRAGKAQEMTPAFMKPVSQFNNKNEKLYQHLP